MKNILFSVSVILITASCQYKAGVTSVQDQSQLPIVPIYNSSVFSDTARVEEAFYQPVKGKRTKQARPARNAGKPLTPSAMPESISLPPVEVPQAQAPPVVTTPAATPAVVGNLPSATGDKNERTGTIETIPQPEKKKGWSSTAKGTVIGAGAGAIGGAILSKKKGKGAIIGGIIGAAGGYVIGKGMDKKDNRLTDY